MLRVVVIEDSPTIRRHLLRTFERTDDIAVVGEAEDGPSGIEVCKRLRPDVITLDLVLPGLSGIAVTEHLMAYLPTPILIVSSADNRDEAHRTYDALAAGAVDVLEKSPGSEAEGAWEERLIAAVRMVARIKVMTHPKGRRRSEAIAASPGAPRTGPAPATAASVVAFGVSTGGPAAMATILKDLTHPCPLPILLVQHLHPAFSTAYAEWLNRQSAHPVSYARDGEPLNECGGRVVMAPAGQHLLVKDGRLRLDHGPERNFCRPSVDVLFESLAAEQGAATLAVLLTGMGRDGAAGLLAIRQRGGTTIAQDEESSIVYGMPKEATRLNAAQSVLPLSGIGAAVSTAIARGAV